VWKHLGVSCSVADSLWSPCVHQDLMLAGPAQLSSETAAPASSQPVARFAPNVVIEKAENTGLYGGPCLCPDGSTYDVADNADYCGSLAVSPLWDSNRGPLHKSSRVNCGVRITVPV
jgi:hypothetical protein